MRPKNKTISAQDTHAQVSREKLLDAAISLVNESGMSSLTIRNICDKAGISTGSFYNLFEGKDDLVSYYLRDVFIAYKQKAEEEASGRTALEKIILIYRFYIDCILETGLEFVTGLYSAMTNPVFNFLERDADEEVVLDRCRQYLEEGIEAGEVKADINMNEALMRIAIIITGNIYYWCVFDGRVDLAYQADSMLQNYLCTLSTDPNCTFDVPTIPTTRTPSSKVTNDRVVCHLAMKEKGSPRNGKSLFSWYEFENQIRRTDPLFLSPRAAPCTSATYGSRPNARSRFPQRGSRCALQALGSLY